MNASRIGPLMDQLNAQLERASVVIRDQRNCVRGSVPLDETRDLAFGKLEGSWGLFIRGMSENGEQVALTKCPMEQRIAAAKVIPALLEALREERAAVEAAIERATDELSAFLDGVEAEDGKAGS